MKYKEIFKEGKIGNLTLKNRMVMCSLAMGVSDERQCIGEDFLSYLMERAKGGVGLIVLENTRVDDEHGVAAPRQASLAREEQIEPLAKAVEKIHKEGVKLFVQLHHPGRETFSNLNSNEPVWSSSNKACGVCQQETHEMTTAEVEQVIQKFINAAVRAQKAGVDGIELHGAHGYLISQFLSPYTNQRTDRFGGSFENRLQFVKEIIEGIKRECKNTLTLGIRLTVDELLDSNGIKEYLTLKDGVKVCKELEKLGLDFIDVSNGIYESFNSLSEPTTYPQGCRSQRIRAVKEAVNIPVIAVNMVKEPWFAQKMLEEGLVDFVGLGRAVVADPEWVNKAKEGREKEINRCISCTFCFETLVSDTIPGKGPVKCAVNPRAGRELRYQSYVKDGKGRTVVVVGAGVAGLEAARVLAEREFHVIVLEKEGKVGGQINIADKPPHKEKMDWLVDYELVQLKKLGVDIRVNIDADKELISSFKPYGIILATGGVPVKPQIPGMDLENALTFKEVLCEEKRLENVKAAVIGSGATGLETAEYLCNKGNDVTIIEMLDSIGEGVYVQHYLDAMDKLSHYPVTYKDKTKLLEIKKDAVILENVKTKKVEEYSVDYVVMAIGVHSVRDLEGTCKDICSNTIVIGDAKVVGRIEGAVRSGFEAGYFF
ncbi:oxidoreductase [Anaerosacchariphilus polymeriproducens]|uniref:FAD-binding protein n=1 Tax=Anaerosacchariphilus polymeriproducens TaxID=1812858 RepID=A0A371AQX9_9FIRM|nr:FAD-dependent oxidoreductase [Anaerosacchariphilus polymeriproducens]RDU21978.1 FAD-binding protein [Anaerosacchariphilus polymeriproducens]